MNMQPIMGAGTNDLRTLWIGDIEPWMNEKHVEDVFNKVGRVISVKLIRSKETNLPAGYCFVEFQAHDMAEKILMNYNSQPIPGASGTFRMNWGKNPTNTGITRPIGGPATGFPSYSGAATASSASSSSAINTPVSEFSIYVGELELGVNEQQLADHFRMKYSSVTSSKIITEPSSKLSKGYGFVKFSNAVEGQRAIHEMNGSIFKGKFIKVSQAVSRQAQLASMAISAAQSYGQYGYPPNNGMDMYGQPLQQYSQYYPQGAQSAGTLPMTPHGQQQQQQQGGYDYYQNQYASYAQQQQQQPQSLAAQQQSYYQSQYPSQYYGQMQQYSQDNSNGYGVSGNSPASSNPSYQPQPQPTPANAYYQQQQQQQPAGYGYYQQASQQAAQQTYLQQQQQQQTQDLQYLANLPQQQQQQAQMGQTPLAGSQAAAIPGASQGYSQIQTYQQQQQQQQLALQAAHQGQYKAQQQMVQQQYPQQAAQLLEQQQLHAQQQQQSQAIPQQNNDENNNNNAISSSQNASGVLNGQLQQGNAAASFEGDKVDAANYLVSKNIIDLGGQERDFLETDVEYVSAAGEMAFVLEHSLS